MMKLKRSLDKLLAIGGMGLAALSFNPYSAKADDISASSNISLITSVDSDGDGLSDDEETNLYGTDPTKFSTDGDDFGDGVEWGNASRDGDPFDADRPGLGPLNSLYEFSSIDNLTTGATTSAISPLFVGPSGERIFYIEAGNDFSSGSIFEKNGLDLSQSRSEAESSLSAELRNIGTDPLGERIYFHKANGGVDEVYSIDRDGTERNVVPGEGRTLDWSVRNPSIYANLLKSDEDLDGTDDTISIDSDNHWVIAETDNNGQIYGFKLDEIGVWDGVTSTPVTNFTNWGNLQPGEDNFNTTARPVVNSAGNKIMYQQINDGGKTRLWVSEGLSEVLEGNSEAFDGSIGAGKPIAHPWDGVSFPGGFGSNGDVTYFVSDINDVYRTTDPLNFEGADFDVFAIPKGSSRVSIPLPGNQISLSAKKGRIVFADDYLVDGAPGGNFNVYATSILPKMKITDGMGADILNGFVTASGTRFDNIPHEYVVSLANAVADDNFSTQTLGVHDPTRPLSGYSDMNSTGTTNSEIYGPTGLQIVSNLSKAYRVNDLPSTPGLVLEKSWTLEDLVLPDGRIIDEEQIAPYEFNPNTQEFEPVPEGYIVSRDLVNRVITYIRPHFSVDALGGPAVGKDMPNAVEGWELYSGVARFITKGKVD